MGRVSPSLGRMIPAVSELMWRCNDLQRILVLAIENKKTDTKSEKNESL